MEWLARGSSVFGVGYMLLILFVLTILAPPSPPDQAALPLFFSVLGCVGLLLGWKCELAGGAVATMGGGFCILAYPFTGYKDDLSPLLMVAPGVLFLLSGILKAWSAKRPPAA
jgi:hypothetical protein